MSRTSNPSHKIPNVWSSSADDFDHSDLAANWDAIDQELTRLDTERMPLGATILWNRRTTGQPAIPWGTGTIWQPCDGRTILSANHDFGGGDFVMPDMRNAVPVGAATPDALSVPALTYPGDGIAAAQGAGPLFA